MSFPDSANNDWYSVAALAGLAFGVPLLVLAFHLGARAKRAAVAVGVGGGFLLGHVSPCACASTLAIRRIPKIRATTLGHDLSSFEMTHGSMG